MASKFPTKMSVAVIQNLLQGSVDMHVHFDPDPNWERRQDAVELALTAEQYGMRAIVLKQSPYPTGALALIVQQRVPNLSVFGSIVLELEIGGLNPYAVESEAKLGAKVVWMPVLSAANSRRILERENAISLKGEGISLIGTGGHLVPQVTDILEIVRDHNMVLATGHISPREIFALAKEAQRVGVPKMIVTHADASMEYEEALTIEQQQQLAQQEILIEHCLWQIMPTGGNLDPKLMVEAIKKAGAQNCVMSTDLGQGYHPPGPEGMRLFIAIMLKYGLSEQEIEYMVKTNPSRLLNLT